MDCVLHGECWFFKLRIHRVHEFSQGRKLWKEDLYPSDFKFSSCYLSFNLDVLIFPPQTLCPSFLLVYQMSSVSPIVCGSKKGSFIMTSVQQVETGMISGKPECTCALFWSNSSHLLKDFTSPEIRSLLQHQSLPLLSLYTMPIIINTCSHTFLLNSAPSCLFIPSRCNPIPRLFL